MTRYDAVVGGRRLGLRCEFAADALLIAFTLGLWDAEWVAA